MRGEPGRDDVLARAPSHAGTGGAELCRKPVHGPAELGGDARVVRRRERASAVAEALAGPEPLVAPHEVVPRALGAVHHGLVGVVRQLHAEVRGRRRRGWADLHDRGSSDERRVDHRDARCGVGQRVALERLRRRRDMSERVFRGPRL